MTYLNHAGTSWPKPVPVREAVANVLAGSPDDWADRLAADHARVARAFGLADPERLLITPGGTSALAVGIADHPWARGDRVLVSGLEHHALHRPATLLGERGVEVTVIPRGDGEPLDVDALRRELARGGVRLVAMTAACNVTGELLPVGDVVAAAHEAGATCLIDAAQVAGWMSVDVARQGIDLLAFTGHKGLHGPWGVGGLLVAPHVVMSSPAASCEVPAAGEPVAGAPATGTAATRSPAACAARPGPCDVGSVDRPALAGLAAALDWLDAPEQTDRLARARRLVERMASALETRPGVRLHGVRDPERRLPVVAFTVDQRPLAEVAEAFAQAGITVGAGLLCAPLAHETLGTAPEGVVRLGAGPSNTDDDVERVLEVVATL